MKSQDLLLGVANTIYAINCHIENKKLHCGALYLEPDQVHKTIRLANNDASIWIQLPDEVLNQSYPIRMWSTTFEVTHEFE